MSLTVVLPTLNEAGNIRALVEGILRCVPAAGIIVVDDGSTDGTRGIVTTLKEEGKPVDLIARTGTPCLTESIWAGIRVSGTEYVAWMDADLSHPPKVLAELYRAAQGSGCAVASRFLDGYGQKQTRGGGVDTVLATVLSATLNVLVRVFLRLRVTDFTSGFIVCRRDLLESHPLVGDYGEYFIELVYYLTRSGVSIIEIPYDSPPRKWGESKTGSNLLTLVRRGRKYLWITLRLVLPRRIFGSLSLAMPWTKLI